MVTVKCVHTLSEYVELKSVGLPSYVHSSYGSYRLMSTYRYTMHTHHVHIDHMDATCYFTPTDIQHIYIIYTFIIQLVQIDVNLQIYNAYTSCTH